jgi:DNA helicase-2/ATP-dependent DNA helicase PcrA
MPSRFVTEVPAHLVEDVGLGSPRRGSGYDTLSGEEHLAGATFSPAVPLATASASRAARSGPGGTAGPRGSTGAEDLGLHPGDEVVHDHWGRGVVVSAKGEGSRAQATVRFDSVGKKNLLLTATPLRRA